MLLVAALVMATGLAVRPALAAYARTHALALLTEKLSTAAGRTVEFTSAEITLGGLVLEDVRVPAHAGEPADPLRVRHATVGTNWWKVLRGQPGGLRSIELEGVTVRVVSAATEQAQREQRAATRPWTAAVLDLGREGVGAVEMRDGVVQVDDAAGTPAIRAGSLVLSLRIGPNGFAYRLAAGSLRGAGLDARGVTADGTGDAHGELELARANVATVAGGSVDLRGGMNASTMAWHAEGSAHGLDLERMATLRGWPTGLDARGAVDATFAVRAGAGGDEIERAEATVHTVGAGALARTDGRVAWQSFEGRVAYDAARREWALAGVRARGEGVALDDGALTLRGGAVDGRVEASGRVQADGAALSRWTNGARVRLRDASAEFRASMSLADIATLRVDGSVRARGLHWRPGSEATALSADRASARFAYRARGAQLSLRDVAVEGHEGRVAGRIDVAGVRWTAALDARGIDAGLLRRHVPGTLRGGRIDAAVQLAGTAGALRSVAGQVELSDARYTAPQGTPLGDAVLSVASASASFRLEQGRLAVERFAMRTDRGSAEGSLEASEGHARVTLRDAVVAGAGGHLAGWVEVAGERWDAAIDGRGIDAEFARAYVPGTLQGGRVSGSVRLAGDAGTLRSATGHVEVSNARYTPPRDLPFAARTLAVASASASFRWAPSRLDVDQIALRGDRLSGEGSLQVQGGRARLHAALRTNDLGSVADAFPTLAGLVRGGTGRGALDLTVDAAGAHGTVLVDAENAGVVPGNVRGAPGVSADGAIPLATGHARVEFSPAGIAVRDATLRGPVANADGWLEWRSRDGGVHVVGSAWLTHETTMQMIVGWRWLAHIVRFRRIGSEFEITGTDARPVLRAAAAHGLLWHFGKTRLSPEMRAMARGEMPLWDHPDAPRAR